MLLRNYIKLLRFLGSKQPLHMMCTNHSICWTQHNAHEITHPLYLPIECDRRTHEPKKILRRHDHEYEDDYQIYRIIYHMQPDFIEFNVQRWRDESDDDDDNDDDHDNHIKCQMGSLSYVEAKMLLSTITLSGTEIRRTYNQVVAARKVAFFSVIEQISSLVHHSLSEPQVWVAVFQGIFPIPSNIPHL